MRGRKAYRVDRKIFQKRIDGQVAALRRRRRRAEQRRNEARRGREFGVLVEVQLVDHRRRQIARGENLNLVLQRRRIGRQRRQHGRRVGHGILAPFEHHRRRGDIPHRPQNQGDQQRGATTTVATPRIIVRRRRTISMKSPSCICGPGGFGIDRNRDRRGIGACGRQSGSAARRRRNQAWNWTSDGYVPGVPEQRCKACTLTKLKNG